MKTLSITVPCYNSQEYMRTCVDSLLKGGEDVEILIVDDGSKDDTLKIAKEYEEKYPTDTAEQSTQVWLMRPDFILRLWTVMTG